MLLRDLLDAPDNTGVTITTTNGTLSATGPRRAVTELGPAIRTHRDILAAALVGRRSGHVLAFCTGCGAATLTAAKTPAGKIRDTWPACRETPRCGGADQHGVAKSRHVPRPVDLEAMRDAPAPPTRPALTGTGKRKKSRFTNDRSAA